MVPSIGSPPAGDAAAGSVPPGQAHLAAGVVTLLRSLESRGLVAGEWEHPERHSRRFYRVTSSGKAERRRLARQLGPNLDAIATTIDVIRHELLTG
jgi:hypothetical protein